MKPTPCRCDRLEYPHRATSECATFDDGFDEIAEQMEREWIADRRADMPYMNGGRS